MCVTCLGSSLHTHNSYSSSLAPLHNLFKPNNQAINILFLMTIIDMYACMHVCKCRFKIHTLSKCVICGIGWNKRLLKTSVMFRKDFNK
jgi:hypothetical protein